MSTMAERAGMAGIRCGGAVLLALLGLATAAPARADCESGVTALAGVVGRVNDPGLLALLQTDLRSAQVDLWEFDEVECAMVLKHAARILSAARSKSAP